MWKDKAISWTVTGTRLCITGYVYGLNWDAEVIKVVIEGQCLRQGGLKNLEKFAELISRIKEDEINVIIFTELLWHW